MQAEGLDANSCGSAPCPASRSATAVDTYMVLPCRFSAELLLSL